MFLEKQNWLKSIPSKNEASNEEETKKKEIIHKFVEILLF